MRLLAAESQKIIHCTGTDVTILCIDDKLNPVELFFRAFGGAEGSIVAGFDFFTACEDRETVGKGGDFGVKAERFCDVWGQALKDAALGVVNRQRGVCGSVLVARRCDGASKLVQHDLHAAPDAQQRNVEFKNLGVYYVDVVGVHGKGATG